MIGPMRATQQGYIATRRRPRWWLVALIVLGHLLAIYGLARAFAPSTVEGVERSVLATFNVTVATPPPPPPPEAAEPGSGEAGEQGRRAVPKPQAAPEPRVPIPRPSPVPRASSTGEASTSGAAEDGAGTGAARAGAGPGAGRGGAGQGGGAVTKPVKIEGDINSAADFPVPPGGRQARFGTSVTVAMTVDTTGRARNCRVIRPSPDPEADAIVCRLAEQRFRFRPATDAAGNPVPATYGWRQEWFAR